MGTGKPSRSDPAYSQGQFSRGAHGGSDTACSGHIVPPGCPAPWSPLSPSACQLISPQLAAQPHRFASKDSQQPHYGAPVQRPFLSAVPMGMYAQHPVGTPAGTSPPQASFLNPQQGHVWTAMRGSPGSAHQQMAGSLPSQHHLSPAHSDTSSRHGMQLSPGLMHPVQSPRGRDGLPISQGPFPDPTGSLPVCL